MTDLERLRAMIRKFEDKKISYNQLGQEILYVAQHLVDERHSRVRLGLLRLGNHFVALAERSFKDDITEDVRDSVDELHVELLGL